MSEPIVETGPVERSAEPAEHEEDEHLEDEELDEEEEEDRCISAAELLSQHRGDEGEEEYFEEEDFY